MTLIKFSNCQNVVPEIIPVLEKISETIIIIDNLYIRCAKSNHIIIYNIIDDCHVDKNKLKCDSCKNGQVAKICITTLMKASYNRPSGSSYIIIHAGSKECSSPDFIYAINKLDAVQKQYEVVDLFEMDPVSLNGTSQHFEVDSGAKFWPHEFDCL